MLEFGAPVLVRYLKYPDTLHWRHPMSFLGEDDHGVWLGAPAGTVIQRGDEPEKTWHKAFVQLIPPSGWWTLIGNDRNSRYAVYVDITTQPVWKDNVVEMVDVDLDVVRSWAGETELLDEDEFLEHQETLDYPAWLVDGARTTAAEVVMAVSAEREPFGRAPLAWFDRMASLSPRTITELTA